MSDILRKLMVQTKSPEITKLGEIKIQSHLYVSLIPTAANSVLVKYDPEIQVSCVIPPREYEILFSVKYQKTNKKTITIKSPSLIMSCGYGDVPTPLTYKTVAHGYGLYAIDESRKKEIWAKPYLLANVWDRGQICFGSLIPGSLRQAFNYYWGSKFNSDLLRSPHVCTAKYHYYHYHVGCFCLKQQNHKCECKLEFSHSHHGCGCNTVAKSKKCKGTCGKEVSSSDNESCYCCLAVNKLAKDALEKNPKLTKMKLSTLIKNPLLSLENNSKYPGCGCLPKHKKSCNCRLRRCDCPCQCVCCLKQCLHTKCECKCCLNKCTCACNCSELQKFTQHLENYHQSLVKDQKWADYTAVFCGIKYWAAPKGADGVLVSNNRQLLNAIPREFWRKDRLGQPLVICLANKQDNLWVFESGGYSFSINANFVITK